MNRIKIDILAKSAENAIFAECKWRNEATGVGTLNELVKKSNILKQFDNRYYILFSKNGFKNQMDDGLSNMKNIELLDIASLFSADLY